MIDLPCARTALCRYRYDALDRLAGSDDGAQEPVWRFYQKSRLSVEIQGALRRSLFQVGDRLLAEHRLSGSTGQSDLLGTDMQRSVLHMQGVQGTQSVAYGPYGYCPPAEVLPGFNGERRDAVTGHYLLGNGYRAYNPVLMRFNQPDSMSPFGQGGLNAYAYCQGDPVNRRDPSGHAPVLSLLEALPGEVLEHVFKFLPGQALSRLSKTSSVMHRRVVGLSRTPKIDISDPRALLKIKQDLQGKTRHVMPAALKRSEAYKAAFEQVARTQEAALVAQIQNVGSQMQSIMDRVAGVGADALKFNDAVTLAKRRYAAFPDIIANIAATKTRYDDLFSQQYMLRQERIDVRSLAKEIRFNLYGAQS